MSSLPSSLSLPSALIDYITVLESFFCAPGELFIEYIEGKREGQQGGPATEEREEYTNNPSQSASANGVGELHITVLVDEIRIVIHFPCDPLLLPRVFAFPSSSASSSSLSPSLPAAHAIREYIEQQKEALSEGEYINPLDIITFIRSYEPPAASLLSSSSSSSSPSSSPPLLLSFLRVYISFHHIYSPQKMDFVLKYSSSLSLSGLLKVGKPGFLCVEGGRDSVEGFVRELKRLNWQRITVRNEEKKERMGTRAELDSFISQHSKFPKFIDLRALHPLSLYPPSSLFLSQMEAAGLGPQGRELIGLESTEDREGEEGGVAAKEADDGRHLQYTKKKEKDKSSLSSSPSSSSSSPSSSDSSLYPFIKSTSSGITLSFSVKPNASSTSLLPFSSSSLSLPLRLSAPPLDNRANDCLLAWIQKEAGFAGLKKAQIKLISGEKSREKVVGIEGIKRETAIKRFQALEEETKEETKEE